MRSSPVARRGRNSCFCSGVPCLAIIHDDSEWLPRMPAMPIQPLAISSKTIANDTMSMPRPPYSSGIVIPKRPSPFMVSTISVG